MLSYMISSIAQPDTLSESYADQWEAGQQINEAPALIQWLSSNDLIFVVLGVSLLIWLVLLFFIIRLDIKVGKLETRLEEKSVKNSGKTDTRSRPVDR